MTSRTRSKNISLALVALAILVALVVIVKVTGGGTDARQSGKLVSVEPGTKTTTDRVRLSSVEELAALEANKISLQARETRSEDELERAKREKEESESAAANTEDSDTNTSDTVAVGGMAAQSVIIISGTVFDGKDPAADAIVVATEIGKEKKGEAAVNSKGLYKLAAL
ncbi:MAG: hypothetical protein ABI579_09470, partial [Candidatus Sumerlaeota bacterium]